MGRVRPRMVETRRDGAEELPEGQNLRVVGLWAGEVEH